MRDAPAAGALAVEPKLGERIEPAGDVDRVAKRRAGFDFALADERLRVDHEPRLALGAKDVGAVQVLVDEPACRAIHGSVDVHRRIEQGSLERSAGLGVPARNVVGPAIRRVGEGRHVRRLGLALQSRDQLADHLDLVDLDVPESRSGHAALDQECMTLVVTLEQLHGALATPELECVGLVASLGVARREELQHGVACGNDERVRRLDRRLELERPLPRAVLDEPWQLVEPRSFVTPRVDEGLREPHGEQRTAPP